MYEQRLEVTAQKVFSEHWGNFFPHPQLCLKHPHSVVYCSIVYRMDIFNYEDNENKAPNKIKDNCLNDCLIMYIKKASCSKI